MDHKPKKSLGQNFLTDNNILKKIFESGNLKKNDNIFEIGPGTGNLTKYFLKSFKKISVIEKDIILIDHLKNIYNNLDNINFISGDILKIDIEKILKNETVVFGNLPYNISSQILSKFLKFKIWPPKYKRLVFMFQKEVGEKIISDNKSKNYSRLGILTKLRLSIKDKFLISRNCFFPKPKVDSMLIVFETRKQQFSIKNIENLEKVTHAFFSRKRKIVKKSFEHLFKDYEKIAKKLKINHNLRPQNLEEMQYYKITEIYEKTKD